MPTQNVNLHEHHSTFIKEMTEGGRYKNASEVVRAGLRLLEDQEEEQRLKLEHLRSEVQKGRDAIEEGRSTTIRSEEELSAFFDDVERRGIERLEGKINAQAGTK
jgi:antitoxin ParD1/3/4